MVWGGRARRDPRGERVRRTLAVERLTSLGNAGRGPARGAGRGQRPGPARGRLPPERRARARGGPDRRKAAGRSAPRWTADELTPRSCSNVDPGPRPTRRRRVEEALERGRLRGRGLDVRERLPTALADVVFPAESHAEKEGTVTHPDGRLQRLRPERPPPWDVQPGWEVLLELSATLGKELGLNTAPRCSSEIASEVPFYAGITQEEIGAMGTAMAASRRRGESGRRQRPERGPRRRTAAEPRRGPLGCASAPTAICGPAM